MSAARPPSRDDEVVLNLPVTAPTAPLARPRGDVVRPQRPWTWCGAAAAATFVLVVVLRHHGDLGGLPAVLLAAGALLVLPSAPTLSGRIFLTGTLVLGLTQLMWWVSLPSDRTGLALAGVTALAVARVVRRGGRPILPSVAPVDLVPISTLALVTLLWWPRLRAEAAAPTLARLLPGYDNLGHFSMFAMTITRGRTVDTLPAPDAHDAWQYAHYPEAFHATTASVAQLIWPGDLRGSEQLLSTFERSTTVLLLLAVVVVTAGVCALPQLRARWDVAAPLSGALAGVFVVGLGSGLVASGFAAFVFPCAMLVAVTLLLLQWQSVRERSHVVAYGAAVLAVAHGWILLLPLVLAMTAVLLPGWRDRLRGSRADWAVCTGAAALTGYGVLRAAYVVTSGNDASALSAQGFIVPTDPRVLIVLLVAPLVVMLKPGRLAAAGEWPDSLRRRGWLLMLSVPLGLVTAGYLAVVSIGAHGHLGYYFYKYVMGLEVVLCCLLVVGLALRVRPEPPAYLTRRPGRALVVVVAVTAVVLPVARLTGQSVDGPAPLSMSAPHGFWRGVADDLVQAIRVPHAAGLRTTYVSSPGRMDPRQAAQWYLALTNAMTSRGNQQALSLSKSLEPHWDLTEATAHARSLLHDPRVRLVVAPDVYAALQGDPEVDLTRVSTWSE